MYYDDLPVWGFIGKVEKVVKTGARKYFLFTHFHFEISYNDDEVIEINVSSDPQVIQAAIFLFDFHSTVYLYGQVGDTDSFHFAPMQYEADCGNHRHWEGACGGVFVLCQMEED